jgi:hypothetical protein
MDFCNEHDDCIVVYDGRSCPFCHCEITIKALEEELKLEE